MEKDNEHKWEDDVIKQITSLKSPSYSMRHAFLRQDTITRYSIRYREAVNRAESLGIDIHELFDRATQRGGRDNIDLIEDELNNIESLQQLDLSMSGSLLSCFGREFEMQDNMSLKRKMVTITEIMESMRYQHEDLDITIDDDGWIIVKEQRKRKEQKKRPTIETCLLIACHQIKRRMK